MIRRDKKDRKSQRPSPYPRLKPQQTTSGGFFQRIRNFFAESTLESDPSSPTKNTNYTNKGNCILQKQYDSLDNFPQDSHLSSIDLTLSHVSNLSTAKNPNDTLADFFQRKGNSALNDVEIEGVMSLIRRVQQHSPANSTLFQQDISHSQSLLNDNTTTILRPSNVDLKTPVKISTPTYVPRTTAIRRPSGNIVPSNGGIKKRIVNYSSLPSPYRARISSPLAAFMEKKRRELENSKVKKPQKCRGQNNTYTGGIIDLTDICKVDVIENKALSKTANKVLKLIDENDNIVKVIEKKPGLKIPTKQEANMEEEEEKKKNVTKIKPIFNFATKNDECKPLEEKKANFNTCIKNGNKEDETVNPIFSFRHKTTESKPVSEVSIKSENHDFHSKKNALATTDHNENNWKKNENFQKSDFDFSISKDKKRSNIKEENSTLQSLFMTNKNDLILDGEIKNSNSSTPCLEHNNIPASLFNGTVQEIRTPEISNSINNLATSEERKKIEDIEIIEKFEFPDVVNTNSKLIEPVENNDIPVQEKCDQYDTPLLNFASLKNKSTQVDFEFPTVLPIEADILDKINERSVEMYADIFKF